MIKRTLLRAAAVVTAAAGLAIDGGLTYLTAGGYAGVVAVLSYGAGTLVSFGRPFYSASAKMLNAASADADLEKFNESQAKEPTPPQKKENTDENANDLSADLANSNKATKAASLTAPAVSLAASKTASQVTPPEKPVASVLSSPPNTPATPIASQSSQIHSTTNVAKTSTTEFLFDAVKKTFAQKSDSTASSSPSGSARLDHKGTDATMTVTKWPSDAATQKDFAWKMAEKFIQAGGEGNKNEIQITINPKKPEEAAYLMAALTAQGANAKFANSDVYKDNKAAIDKITSAKEQFAEMKKPDANSSSTNLDQPKGKEQTDTLAPPPDSAPVPAEPTERQDLSM